jgi:hypothetical protein
MAAAWCLLGAIAALNTCGSLQDGWLGLIAHLVANLVFGSVAGVLLGLVSSRWRETVVGGLTGFVVACVLTEMNADDFLLRNAGLNAGALIAITCWPFIRAGNVLRRALFSSLS